MTTEREPAMQPATDPKTDATSQSRALLLGALALLLGKACLLVVASWRVRFVMDEFSFISQYLDFGDGLYTVVDPIKTILAALYFNLPRAATADPVGLLLGARLLGALLGLGILVAVYLAARRLGEARFEALLAPALLASFSNFAEHGFRIRSDLAAAFCAMAGLVALTTVGSAPAERRKSAWLAGCAAGIAFLCTQKAAYVLAAFLAAAALAGGLRAWRSSARSVLWLLAGWAAMLAVYALAFGGAHAADVLVAIFRSPSRLALSDYQAFADLRQYVTQTLVRNPVAYAIGVLGVIAAARTWTRLAEGARRALVVTVVMMTLIFLHNQPWPYVFVLALPFLALWAPTALRSIATLVPGRATRTVAAWAMLALVLFSFGRTLRMVALHTNDEQLAVVRAAASLLGPNERYFDAMGMVPTRRLALAFPDWWWDAPFAARERARLTAGDAALFQRLLAGTPKLWILTYRFLPFRSEIAAITRHAYARVGDNLLLAGTRLEPAGGARFECRWPGRYRLFDLAGKPLGARFRVDDGPETDEAAIALGSHTVRRVDGGGEALLLPADAHDVAALPETAPVPHLFAEVYDF